jgi:hypothetical protein
MMTLTRVFLTVGLFNLIYGTAAIVFDKPEPVFAFNVGFGVILILVAIAFSQDLRRLR